MPARSDDAGRGAPSGYGVSARSRSTAIAMGQLDGTLKTARRVVHELGNALAPARGCSELLPAAAPETATAYVAEIAESIVGEIVRRDRLGGLVHEYERSAA